MLPRTSYVPRYIFTLFHMHCRLHDIWSRFFTCVTTYDCMNIFTYATVYGRIDIFTFTMVYGRMNISTDATVYGHVDIINT